MLNRVKPNPAQLRREPRSSYSISCNRFLEICPVSLKHPSSQSLPSCSWASGQKSKALVSTSASHILFPSWPATGAKWGQARERKKQQGVFPYFWGQFFRSWRRVSFLNYRCLPSHRGLHHHHLCRAAPGLTQENKQQKRNFSHSP